MLTRISATNKDVFEPCFIACAGLVKSDQTEGQVFALRRAKRILSRQTNLVQDGLHRCQLFRRKNALSYKGSDRHAGTVTQQAALRSISRPPITGTG